LRPGCRVPAHRADADHSVEHAAGGETVDTNIGPSCRHDHRLRHEGGWTITHTQPGHFTWTSRLGHTYHRQPPPDLADLPDPMPTPIGGDRNDDDDTFADPSTEDWQNSTCMQLERPRRPAPPPPPEPPPPPPEDDIPPF
jgi:hypothetical protein